MKKSDPSKISFKKILLLTIFTLTCLFVQFAEMNLVRRTRGQLMKRGINVQLSNTLSNRIALFTPFPSILQIEMTPSLRRHTQFFIRKTGNLHQQLLWDFNFNRLQCKHFLEISPSVAVIRLVSRVQVTILSALCWTTMAMWLCLTILQTREDFSARLEATQWKVW